MLKSFHYTARLVDDQDRVFVSKTSETTMKIIKAFSTHWANQGLDFGDHLVLCGNSWDVHPINTSDPDNYYRTLAESGRGPQIIALGNAVCTQFHVNSKYPASFRVLQNYVIHMMSTIHSTSDRLDIPMAMARQQPGSKPVMKGTTASRSLPADAAGKHFVGHELAKHSGYAFSKRTGPVIVRNNATTAGTVKAMHGSLGGMEEEEESMNSSGYSFEQKASAQSINSIKKAFKKRQRIEKRSVPKQISEPLKPEFTGSFGDKVLWTAQEVREFLHPGYPTATMPKVINMLNSITRSPQCQSVLKKPSVKVITEQYSHSRTASRMENRKTMSERTLPGSIRIETPYIDPEKAMLFDQQVTV